MDRREYFDSFKEHAWLQKVFKKLKTDDIACAHEFIEKNKQLDVGDFEFAINRMFMDNMNKPKRWKEISELLTCANTAFRDFISSKKSE